MANSFLGVVLDGDTGCVLDLVDQAGPQSLLQRVSAADGWPFALDAREPDGRAVRLRPSVAAPPRVTSTPGRARVTYEQVVDGERGTVRPVTVAYTVQLDTADPQLSLWRLSVDNRDPHLQIEAAAFPTLRGIGAGGFPDMVMGPKVRLAAPR